MLKRFFFLHLRGDPGLFQPVDFILQPQQVLPECRAFLAKNRAQFLLDTLSLLPEDPVPFRGPLLFELVPHVLRGRGACRGDPRLLFGRKALPFVFECGRLLFHQAAHLTGHRRAGGLNQHILFGGKTAPVVIERGLLLSELRSQIVGSRRTTRSEQGFLLRRQTAPLVFERRLLLLELCPRIAGGCSMHSRDPGFMFGGKTAPLIFKRSLLIRKLYTQIIGGLRPDGRKPGFELGGQPVPFVLKRSLLPFKLQTQIAGSSHLHSREPGFMFGGQPAPFLLKRRLLLLELRKNIVDTRRPGSREPGFILGGQPAPFLLECRMLLFQGQAHVARSGFNPGFVIRDKTAAFLLKSHTQGINLRPKGRFPFLECSLSGGAFHGTLRLGVDMLPAQGINLHPQSGFAFLHCPLSGGMLGGALGCNIGKLPLQGINLRPQRRFPFLHRGLSRRAKFRLQGPPRLLRSRLFITKGFFPPGGLGGQKILRLRFHPPEHIFLETLQISGPLRTFRKKPFLEFLLELPAENFPGPDLLLHLSLQPGDFIPCLLEFRGRDCGGRNVIFSALWRRWSRRSRRLWRCNGFRRRRHDLRRRCGRRSRVAPGAFLSKFALCNFELFPDLLLCRPRGYLRPGRLRSGRGGLCGSRGRLAGRGRDIQLLNVALGYRVLDPLFICLGIGIVRICLHRHLDQPRGTLEVASFEELVGHLQEIAGLLAPFLLLCVVSFSHSEKSSSSLFLPDHRPEELFIRPEVEEIHIHNTDKVVPALDRLGQIDDRQFLVTLEGVEAGRAVKDIRIVRGQRQCTIACRDGFLEFA
jgi:hypothetical protein